MHAATVDIGVMVALSVMAGAGEAMVVVGMVVMLGAVVMESVAVVAVAATAGMTGGWAP